MPHPPEIRLPFPLKSSHQLHHLEQVSLFCCCHKCKMAVVLISSKYRRGSAAVASIKTHTAPRPGLKTIQIHSTLQTPTHLFKKINVKQHAAYLTGDHANTSPTKNVNHRTTIFKAPRPKNDFDLTPSPPTCYYRYMTPQHPHRPFTEFH